MTCICPITYWLNHYTSISASAYTVGIVNFSDMVATLLGSGVISWSRMKTVGENCDFEVLPYLIVISQILVPLAVGIPVIFMIPNVLQTEQMIDWERESWLTESDNKLGPWQHANKHDEEETHKTEPKESDLCETRQ